MINIISTFYVSNYASDINDLRTKEIETSLINNLSSPFIEKIHLFIDNEKSHNRLNEITGNSDKIIVICVGKKPNYSDFFEYIINNINDKICMITNADIYLDFAEMRLLDLLNNDKIAYALTRYEYDFSCPLINNYCGSHDCYIFNSKFIDKTIINEHTNFYQNFPGIESHIIKALCDCGLKVLNPCQQIKIVHLHKTQLRNHGNWIGLHNYGDFEFHMKSCWWVPPIIL